MRRTLAIALVSSALLTLAGCKGPCRELSERLCDCAQSSTVREFCIQRAANEQSRFEPTAEEESVCEQRLEQCDCHTIDTAEGKVACGLAR
ncbi:hypothetical protein P2318_05085 [Myxococcaceae bacterium GXIMD 01537]